MIGAALAVVMFTLTASAAFAQLQPADAPSALNDTRCGVECLRCAADGCVKCARLLVWPGGTCTHKCPSGTREAWAHDDHLMGRVCYPSRKYNEIIVGAACGAVLCIGLVAAGAAYARCRRKERTRAQPQQLSRHEDDAQLRQFHKQLDCLRPHAYTLLAVLNHTRHQVRELYLLGNNEAAMAYSCVLSDLSKLLILLNKQQVPIVPDDWTRLASWADRVLKRYGRFDVNEPQEDGPLVDFLPSPPSHTDSETTQQSFTTFKPTLQSPGSRATDDLENDDTRSEEWNEGRPPSYTQIEKENITLNKTWERKKIVRRDSVWLEDELFEMTRRPQDEITTEL